MSAPFTNITALTDLQDLSLYTQVYLAYCQRHNAANTPLIPEPFSLPAAGHDIQYYDFYAQLQAWLDGSTHESWEKYLDHTATIIGAADLPHYTLAQWRYVAGLHPDGFRRVAGNAWPADWTDLDDPAYTYGHCQPGDIIGPWLLVDLQRGFSALRWSYGICSPTPLASYYETWANWAALVASPLFTGLTAAGDGVERYFQADPFGVLGFFRRQRWQSNPWASLDRTVQFYAIPFADVLDGCGDFTLVSGLNLLHAQGPDKLPVSWDSPSGMSFTPPADPGIGPVVGYDFDFYAVVIQWDFTNI